MKFSLLVASLVLFLYPLCANAQDLRVRIDLSEAEAILSAANALRDNSPIAAAQLESVLQTPAGKHLTKTQALTAENIKRYVTSAEFSAQAGAFQSSLREWRTASLQRMEHRVGEYLPPEGQLSLTVVVVLAPGFTDAEFDTTSNSAPRVFVPLVPYMPHMRVETYADEQVYLLASAIATRSLRLPYDQMAGSVRLAVEYMTEFRRGIALLASAGGPALHLCSTCPRAERHQWDNDLVAFSTDLQALDKLLLATALAADLEGQRSQLDSVGVVPWQVVGYRMADIIERHYGRKVVPNLLRNPRMLLELYNLAAADDNVSASVDKPLPLWSPELMRMLGLTPSRDF